MSERHEIRVSIPNRLGLHARPAMAFADTASEFAADVRVTNGDESVNGKSVMEIMMLAATQGTEILISAEGADAAACIGKLADLVRRGFDET